MGICQGFFWILSGLKYPVIYPYEFDDNEKFENYCITGPTLDSHDVFADNISLPSQIKVGDFLLIYPAGAYIDSSKNYNGFEYPEIKVF